MSVTRPVVKTETLKKKNAASLGNSLPLESGQLESWYFHLGASNGISVGIEPTTLKQTVPRSDQPSYFTSSQISR